jgi:hypothetical protein
MVFQMRKDLFVFMDFQITRHWSMNLKPEMTLDKLQFIATAVVSSNFKVHWLTWWNSSVHTRSALHFPATPFSDKDFESWLNRAAFWAEVSPFALHVVFSS